MAVPREGYPPSWRVAAALNSFSVLIARSTVLRGASCAHVFADFFVEPVDEEHRHIVGKAALSVSDQPLVQLFQELLRGAGGVHCFHGLAQGEEGVVTIAGFVRDRGRRRRRLPAAARRWVCSAGPATVAGGSGCGPGRP